MSQFHCTSAWVLDELEWHFRVSYDSEGWRQTLCFPGVPELLETLKRNSHRLFIISNKPRHISAKILEALGIAPHFEQIYTRDSAQPPYASKEAMLDALLSDHRLAPEACVMVGDTMEDAEAASGTGMQFCFVTHGYGAMPEGSSVPVALRIDHFSELVSKVAQE